MTEPSAAAVWVCDCGCPCAVGVPLAHMVCPLCHVGDHAIPFANVREEEQER
jgi:hypothetical protein